MSVEDIPKKKNACLVPGLFFYLTLTSAELTDLR